MVDISIRAGETATAGTRHRRVTPMPRLTRPSRNNVAKKLSSNHFRNLKSETQRENIFNIKSREITSDVKNTKSEKYKTKQ